jgi:hypothetical protein
MAEEPVANLLPHETWHEGEKHNNLECSDSGNFKRNADGSIYVYSSDANGNQNDGIIFKIHVGKVSKGQQFSINTDVADDRHSAIKCSYMSLWLGPLDWWKNGNHIDNPGNYSDPLTLTVDSDYEDAYLYAGFHVGPFGSATLLRMMVNAGQPAAWAPAEGDSIAPGGVAYA